MPKVSISQAAKLAGVSRQHLYKKWITPGLVSVERDGETPPVIDVSELLRVFGTLHGHSQVERAQLQEATADEDSLNCRVLKAELAAARSFLAERETQLQEAKEREAWLQQHVSEVTGALRRLEHKKDADETAARLKKALETIAKYRNALERERNKGFWARLLGH